MAGGDLRATRLGKRVLLGGPRQRCGWRRRRGCGDRGRTDLGHPRLPPGQVLWFYKLDTDRDIQDRYPRGWREFDYLISTATMRSFPDTLLQAREAQRRSRVVASFGRGAQRVEIRKVQGSPL